MPLPQVEVCYSALGSMVTPAMAAGVSDHVWTVEEIVELAD